MTAPLRQASLATATMPALSTSAVAANKDVPVGMDIWHNSPQCPHCADLWKQADCTISGPLKDSAGALADGIAADTFKGALTAGSAGTSVAKGILASLKERHLQQYLTFTCTGKRCSKWAGTWWPDVTSEEICRKAA